MRKLRNFIYQVIGCCLIGMVLGASNARAEKWDAVDGTLFSGLIGLQIVDTVQTMEAMEDGYGEVNPILRHPTYPKLIAVKSLMVGSVYYLVKDMPSADRKLILGILDAMYIGVVHHNYTIGVRVGF